MIKAVIFDLDGTLVDTIPVYMKAYIRVIQKELGLRVKRKQIEDKFGKKATDIMAELLQELGRRPAKGELAELIEKVRGDFRQNFGKVGMLPGAYKLLGDLKERGYPLALATSSRNYAVKLIFAKFGLRKYFNFIVCGDDISRSKPDPEIFLKAAKGLSIEPKDCLVVEDAVYGIEAAKAAGMKALAVRTGGYSGKNLENCGADMVIDSLEDFDYSILN